MLVYCVGILAIVGHISLWIRSVNWLHGSTLPHGLTHPLTYALLLWIVVGFVWFLPPLILEFGPLEWGISAFATLGECAVMGYIYLASGLGILAILTWFIRRIVRWRSGVSQNVFERSRIRRFPSHESQLRRRGSLWLRFPGSQALELELVRRELRLPPPIAHEPLAIPIDRESSEDSSLLSPLRVLHLTDLHFGGGVPLAYYDWAIDQIRATLVEPCLPEYVLVTGDFLDRDDWRREMIVRLRRLSEFPVRHGVWFVLGNHDFRLAQTESTELRRTLVEECGFHDLGGRIARMKRVNGTEVELIGDESPWGKTPSAENLPWMNRLGLRLCSSENGGRTSSENSSKGPLDSTTIRIILTHTPDRFPIWAKRLGSEAGVVLAGHTHGGQMRIPGIGAVLTPCVTGTTFADGVFRRNRTLLQVGRGLAAQNPLRLFCPPEAVLLEIIPTPHNK